MVGYACMGCFKNNPKERNTTPQKNPNNQTKTNQTEPHKQTEKQPTTMTSLLLPLPKKKKTQPKTQTHPNIPNS